MQLSELLRGPSFSKWYIKPKKRLLNLKFWLVKQAEQVLICLSGR